MKFALLLVPALVAAALEADPPAKTGAPEESPERAVRDAPPTLADTAPRDAAGLHNVVAFGPAFWSGSVPEGDAGFATLRAWGVRTVISVDGAGPDVERATRFGIRYVHLPIGYNGFDEARKVQIVRAVRDLPGPIYVHCHHGKHRSAGAAGAVAASLGWLTATAAVERMRVAGTAPGYTQLYACTADARPLAAAAIDGAAADFPSVTRPRGMVEAMVAIDEANDRLRLVERAGWKTPEDHPDVVPSAEAGAVADHLRLLAGAPEGRARPQGFLDLLRAGQAAAERLESGLASKPVGDHGRLAADLKALQASCKDCHSAYRDTERPGAAQR